MTITSCVKQKGQIPEKKHEITFISINNNVNIGSMIGEKVIFFAFFKVFASQYTRFLSPEETHSSKKLF